MGMFCRHKDWTDYQSNLLTLSKLWSSTLSDYAKLTLDGDLSAEHPSNELNNSKNMDVYVAAVRQITLPVCHCNNIGPHTCSSIKNPGRPSWKP